MKSMILSAGIFLFLTISALSVFTNSANSQPKFEIGSRFSAISLPSLQDGKPMSIENFRGEKVILHVFASW